MEIMKIMATSFKRSHARTATLSAPNPAAGHHQPTPLPGTPRHPETGLGQSPVLSLLLSPGSWCIRFCCALQESIFHSCVSSGSSMMGLMASSSKRAYAITNSADPEPSPDSHLKWDSDGVEKECCKSGDLSCPLSPAIKLL